jgi:hypothetical protein
MRNASTVTLAILSLLLSGCELSQHPESFPVQGSIIRYVQQNCSSASPCTLRIRDLTHFEWERMYVFSVGSSLSDRERIVGQPGVQSVDLEGEMVFTKAGKIVHQEPMPEGVELPLKNEVGFAENTNTGGHSEYSPITSFSVAISQSKNGRYFVLSRIDLSSPGLAREPTPPDPR